MSQLGSSFPSFPMSDPSLPQSLSLANQASTLSLSVMDGQSALIGHSNGGLVSRYARANIGSGARSIITVGTPNAGVPMLFQSNWLAVQSGLIVFEIVEVGTMWILDAWDMYATEYWSAVATAGAIFGYTYAIDYAHDYISSFSAFLGDDLPGSTFLSGLPSAGSNSFSLNVTLGAGAGGGPIALVESPSAADNWGAGLFAAGALLEFYAYQAQFEIDYTRPDWFRTAAACIRPKPREPRDELSVSVVSRCQLSDRLCGARWARTGFEPIVPGRTKYVAHWPGPHEAGVSWRRD